MRSRPAIDPFTGLFAESDAVAAGLAHLEQGPPLWGDRPEWSELIARLRAFETPFGARARLACWSMLELYGLHLLAPRARLSAMGAAFIVCLRGHQVVEIDAKAITMVSRTAARLRLYRGEVDPDAVLAWEAPTSLAQ
jgi:hypothetical protein